MLRTNLILVLCFFLLSGGTLTAQDFEYIGAKKCKICHNKPETGKQYKIWMAGKHANAMKSLSNEESLKYAMENGITDPATDPGCIKCHSTVGSTDENLHAGLTIKEGVSCETCHGPGSAYKPKKVMINQAKSLEKGLIIPDQKLCETCHNEENPFHKEFDFEKYMEKIAHPNPMEED